jgi:hypothetical protein
MGVDLSKVQFASTYNAFKNNNTLYTGSISFPTSLTSGQQSITTQAVPISVSPQFSKFYANFWEVVDRISSTSSAQWYEAPISAYSVGIQVTAPAPNVGVINCGVYPVLIGNQMLVTAQVNNPYSNGITLGALTVPYAFIEYTLAN